MKKLLLFSMLFVGLNSFAQLTCATATNITANGTLTCPAITGTYVATCLASSTGIKAIWYKYTPAANGEITVSTVLAANSIATTDTRVSILKGACGTQTCVDSNDDVDPNAATPDYRSKIIVPVAAGTTYYIEWDSRWAATGFQFTFNFTAASCIRPGAADFYLPDTYTTNSVRLVWNQAIGAPASYDVDWNTDFAAAAGTGTIVNSPAGALTYATSTLTALPANQNFRYFVRSNCGATQSAWQGPNYAYLGVVLPYSNDFNSAANNYTDGFIGFSLLSNSTTATPPILEDGANAVSGDGSLMFTSNSTTAVSNRWAYSRAVSLVAGEVVTLNFKTRLYAQGTTVVTPMTMDVTVGSSQGSANQTEIIGSLTESTDTQYNNQSFTYTALTDGVYNFGFHNNSPIGATQTYLFFDSLNISSVLSTNNYLLSKFNVYPNPATNVINFSNNANAIVSSVEMSDLNGRVIKSVKVNATEGQISVNDLAIGVYMMKIITDQGVAIKKIVKQ